MTNRIARHRPGATVSATADSTAVDAAVDAADGSKSATATDGAKRPARAKKRRTRTRTGRRPAPELLAQAYGDGLDPDTGRPWTNRALGEAAGVHHKTAGTWLRARQAGAPVRLTAVPGGTAPERSAQ